MPLYIHANDQPVCFDDKCVRACGPATTQVWVGLGNELFTDADKFELHYPINATPAAKGLLLGAVFYLNMNFFEKQNDQGGA